MNENIADASATTVSRHVISFLGLEYYRSGSSDADQRSVTQKGSPRKSLSASAAGIQQSRQRGISAEWIKFNKRSRILLAQMGDSEVCADPKKATEKEGVGIKTLSNLQRGWDFQKEVNKQPLDINKLFASRKIGWIYEREDE